VPRSSGSSTSAPSPPRPGATDASRVTVLDIPTKRGRLRHVVLGSPGTIAGTVYGTIVVMGAITAGA
jgi:hypothetical protein